MTNSFHFQREEAMPGVSPEHAHGPGESAPPPSLTDARTGPISHIKRSQFVKPGFIDTSYSASITQRETPSRIRAIHMKLLSSPRKVASPPYARTRMTMTVMTQQYVILMRVLLAQYRLTWPYQVFGGLLVPISFAFVIVAVGGAGNRDAAIYLLGGNLALSIATGPAAFLVTRIGSTQQSKEFHYWIALPVSKLLLVLAIVSVALLFALPGLVGIYVLGSLLLRLPFDASAWVLLPLIPLGVLPLTGLGVLLGTTARNGEVASILSNVMVIFIGVLSPVVLPLESLPVPLRILSQFIPTTYLADAFRALLGGPRTHLTFDLIILTLFSVVLLTLTYFRMDWRNT